MKMFGEVNSKIGGKGPKKLLETLFPKVTSNIPLWNADRVKGFC